MSPGAGMSAPGLAGRTTDAAANAAKNAAEDATADASHQVARVALRAGAVSLDATVRVTAGGLLAVAALVSAILLSTAVLVREAKR